MIYKINENKLRELIKEALTEAMGFGFSLGYLKTIPTYSDRVKYCRQTLGAPIGNGSSRICFQLDDERILKLAKNDKGIAQNEQEGQADYYRDSFGVYPKVFYELSDEENYTYIVSEYVLPVKEQDFRKILKMKSNDFYMFLFQCATAYSKRGRKFFDNYRFETMIENNPSLENWYNFMNDYQVEPMDLRNANFGMALRDGEPEIVMLDSGLTEEIFNDYYRFAW